MFPRKLRSVDTIQDKYRPNGPRGSSTTKETWKLQNGKKYRGKTFHAQPNLTFIKDDNCHEGELKIGVEFS